MTYHSVCSAAVAGTSAGEKDTRPTYKKPGATNATKSKIHPVQSSVITQEEYFVEKVNIDKVFHPFITGAYNKVVEEIMEETGAHINVPPLKVNKTEIVVSGEKEQVALAVAKINTIYEDKRKSTTTIAVELKKSQHKYVIGPNEETLQKILDETSVSVEVPPHSSSSETIILRGEPGRLVQALTEVFIKATSYTVYSVSAPSRLFHLINLAMIMQQMPTVHIKFIEGENEITLEGPTKHVEMMKSQIEAIITVLVNRVDHEVTVHNPPENEESNLIGLEEDPQDVSQRVCVSVPITKEFHKYLIGKKGSNIKKIQQETNTTIFVPSELSKGEMIVITGTQANCEDARCRILAIEEDLLEYVGRHLTVSVPQKYHGRIIGSQGANIKPICAEHNVRVLFPEKNDNKDEITIVGSVDNARAAQEAILAIVEGCGYFPTKDKRQKEMEYGGRHLTISVPQKYHGRIIGSQGANIKPICAEHNVRVLFPEKNDYKDEITIVGSGDNAIAAQEAILAIVEGCGYFPTKDKLQKEMVFRNFKLTVPVAQKFHSKVIGHEGANIKPICAEHNVRVLFPEMNGDCMDEITIVGSVYDARAAQDAILATMEGPGIDRRAIQSPAKAEKRTRLQQLAWAEQMELRNLKLTVPVPQKYHGRIIGSQGANLKPICAEHNVRVLFPEKNDNKDEITIVGSVYDAKAARDAILAILEGIEEVISEAVPLDSRVYDRISRNSQEIGQMFKVDITCPQKRAGEVNHMTVKGYPRHVNEVIEELINLEEDFMLALKEKAQIPAGDRAAATTEGEAKSHARRRALATTEGEAKNHARRRALATTEGEAKSHARRRALATTEGEAKTHARRRALPTIEAPDISSAVDFPTVGAPVANRINLFGAWC